jgi:hypothetical protein
MTTKSSETLDSKIERLVREHLAEQQGAAKVALERAFAAVAAPRPAARRPLKLHRRESAEVTDLVERLFDAVRACPGETMTVISARVGQKPRALQWPMMRLKHAGRVRSAGERNFTRYFPMVSTRSA